MLTAVAIAGVMLAAATGCGGQKAASPSDLEIAYSVVPEEPGAAPAGIFLADAEGKHHRRLTRVLSPPEAVDVSWSPTSDLLLFWSMLGETWTIRADGSELRKIATGAVNEEPRWSPDGKLIAVGGRRGVQILSPDGKLQKRISPVHADGSVASTPSWSPDGAKVAFVMSALEVTAGEDLLDSLFVAPVRGDGGAVLLVGPASSPGHGLTLESGTPSTPFWSPDGGLIAFWEGELEDIWTIRADGTRLKRVASGVLLGGWAPDGRGVLCSGSYNRDPELRSPHVCPLDGGSWRPLTLDEEKRVRDRDRHYSPGGRQLATATAGGALVVSRADGSKRRILTRPEPPHQSPQWSPDGDRLTFVQDERATSDDEEPRAWVYVIGGDGRSARRLVESAGEAPAAWLPDGARLLVQQGAYPSDTYISVVTLEGRTRRLAENASLGLGSAPALAPDGTQVAYLREKEGSYRQALYVIGTQGGPERKVLDLGENDMVDYLAWSSDGRALFVQGWLYSVDHALQGDLSHTTLYEVALSGSARVVATGLSAGGFAVSPRGGEVAVGRYGGQALAVVDLENGTTRELVLTPVEFPQWSPDGSTIAYLTFYDDTGMGLETVRADGSERRRVSAAGEEVESFSWRPSGPGD